MEDLGFSARDTAWRDTLDDRFEIGSAQPVHPDGGLNGFGHPIGASGLRMMYEMRLRFRGDTGPGQVEAPRLGLTHDLGGAPGPLYHLRLGRRGQPMAEGTSKVCGRSSTEGSGTLTGGHQ